MLFPRVKFYREKEGFLEFDRLLKVYFADEIAITLTKAFELLIPYPFEIVDLNNADLIIKSDTELSNKNSYYTVDVSEKNLIVRFSNREGGRDAISVIAELLKFENNVIKIKRVYIEDWADLKFRSFMQDVGRKYVPIDEMKSQLLLMAKMRMNVLHFHFTEHTGFGIALKDFPKLKGASVTNGKQYTEEEIIEIVEFADMLVIDVIPEIDLPAHANAITNAFTNILCQTNDSTEPNGWALCVGNEETYVFLEKLITSVSKLFKSKYFHLGTDEISMHDCDRTPKPVADWSRCKVCTSISDNETELFYYFVRRAYSILQKLNKKMIIWNDQIDISKSPDLPHDIIIEFWRVAGPHRGPIEGCSMQRFLEEGFDVINANYPDTYIDLYVDYDRLIKWNVCKYPADDTTTKGKIIGADFCAWDVFSHYIQSVPISTLFFAERFRNTDFGSDQSLLLSASTRLFGIENFNIFDYTQKVIDLDESLDIFKENIDREKLRKILLNHNPRDISEEYIQKTYLSFL